MTERPGHENRVDLYDKTKETILNNNPSIHPDLLARMASDPRLQPGHPKYQHSGIDRLMTESGHIETHKRHLDIVKMFRERDPHAYNAYGGWYTDSKWSPEYKPTPEKQD
jgi:hypothetical protein